MKKNRTKYIAVQIAVPIEDIDVDGSVEVESDPYGTGDEWNKHYDISVQELTITNFENVVVEDWDEELAERILIERGW